MTYIEEKKQRLFNNNRVMRAFYQHDMEEKMSLVTSSLRINAEIICADFFFNPFSDVFRGITDLNYEHAQMFSTVCHAETHLLA